jgi:trehalose 2-sulfotransferase
MEGWSMFSESTNSAKFDFPEFYDNTESYIIASTPRCGSTLLGHLLWKSEFAGAPHEYFHPSHAQDYQERWGYKTKKEYVDLLRRWRTTPNGLFGVKLHFYQIDEFGLDFKSIDELLDQPKYVFIRRKTKIRQAISLVKAEQTNQYALELGDELMRAEYDFTATRDQFFRLIDEENKWEEYFNAHNIEPLVVWYEDLAEDYTKVLVDIFHFLSVEISEDAIPEPSIYKMSDATTEEWVKQFNLDMEIYERNGSV